MDSIPFIDWDRNGRIDSEDIALSLAIADEAEETEGEEEDDDDDYL